jgi:hypothetical protein
MHVRLFLEYLMTVQQTGNSAIVKLKESLVQWLRTLADMVGTARLRSLNLLDPIFPFSRSVDTPPSRSGP